MSLKFKVDSIDTLPEVIRDYYSEKDGAYYLDVEGVVSKDKHNEFRQHNIDLRKQLEAYGGILPEDVQKFKKIAEAGPQVDEEKVNQIVGERVKTRIAEFDSKEGEYQNTIGTLNTRLSSLLIDTEVKSSAIKNGVAPSAVEDVMLRARLTFSLKDGEIQAVDGKGHLMYDKDGTTPMSIDTWVKNLKKAAPHLFDGHVGSGAPGSGRPGAGSTANMTATQKIAAGLGG